MRKILTHDEWMDQFVKLLVQSGLPQPQAEKYNNIYASEATAYYLDGVSAGDAVTRELLPNL